MSCQCVTITFNGRFGESATETSRAPLPRVYLYDSQEPDKTTDGKWGYAGGCGGVRTSPIL
jgi:hypothetical protein